MGAPYPNEVRDKARDLWLAGGMSDPQIATAVGVERPDTIRDWRRAGDWESFRAVVERTVKERVAKDEKIAVKEMNRRHDKLGEAIESAIARLLRQKTTGGEVRASGTELRAWAGALALVQGVRRKAHGIDRAGKDENVEAKKFATTFAEIMTGAPLYREEDDPRTTPRLYDPATGEAPLQHREKAPEAR